MKFQCPHCSIELECDPSSAGQMVSCPQCNGNFVIPVPTATPAATVVQSRGNDSVEQELMQGGPSIMPYLPALILGVLLLPVGIGLIIILIVAWRRASFHYVLTTKKLKTTRGVIIKNEAIVRLNDIRGVAVRRGFWDALCGTCTLVVGTAATADAEVIMPHIANGKRIQQLIDEMR